MAGPAHQIPGRQAPGGELHAHALDPAPPGTARTGRPECQPVIWPLGFYFGHRSLRVLCLPSQDLCSGRCAVRDECHQRGAIGPDDGGPSHLASEPGRSDRGIMKRLTFPPGHDIEGTRHTLAYGQYRLSYETYGSGDRVLVW